MEQARAQARAQTRARANKPPIPLVSACVGALCLVAYVVPHHRLLFAPPDGSQSVGRTMLSWLAPAFEHAGPMHLFFNLYWLYELGPLVEATVPSALVTLMLYAAIIAASNAAQFVATGPNFLGLSGLVFGLVGFLAAAVPHFLLGETVRLFAIWFVLCVVLTGLGLLPIANSAHGAGAAAGALLGWLWARA